MKSIAIIGSGIAGMGAAYALKDVAEVTVFEKRDRLGGHACTKTIEYDGARIDVDVGFIVYNALNYPNLIGFFDALDVQTEASDMSFAVSDPDGFEWASTARGFFADKRNLFSLKFHRFWRTILRFNDTARADLKSDLLGDVSLGAWLDQHGFDDTFRANYILPMGAAIWSTPEAKITEYPAHSFFSFFDNHRLMHKERPKWRTVSGGSQQYVRKVADCLADRVRLGAGIASISRLGGRILVIEESGARHQFDDVIVATHSDQAAKLLDDSFDDRRFLLGSARYRSNTIYLHRDESLMPKRRTAWASWNVIKQANGDICLTYWMNKLQGLDPSRPLFVTLNPHTPPREHLVFDQFEFDHPQFDAPALAAVRALSRKQGELGLWLAGAWMGHGFHEDGLKSGLSAALSLGGSVPWSPEGVSIIDAPLQETLKPMDSALSS